MAECPAKQCRYSSYEVNEFNSIMHDGYRKFMKREYMKQKHLSTEYRQRENLKQRDRDAQRRLSTELRQKEEFETKRVHCTKAVIN